ncbi:hypothetical protein TNCV_4860601 [Trichonephila clavipes]|nr:hypothetical protein TNCV_4860601 [Trichonephila clavipes]
MAEFSGSSFVPSDIGRADTGEKVSPSVRVSQIDHINMDYFSQHHFFLCLLKNELQIIDDTCLLQEITKWHVSVETVIANDVGEEFSALEENILNGTVRERERLKNNAQKGTLLRTKRMDSGMDIELAIPFVPNYDHEHNPQQAQLRNFVHYHPSE